MYTVKIVKNKLAILTSTTLSETITIKSNDKRFDKCVAAAKAKRLVNITTSGRFTSSKDYHGAYENNPTTKSTKKKLNVSKLITTMADLNIDADALEPLKTGTVFDKFMSNEGGFLPGTNVMAAGAPGVGKTTLLLELLYGVQQTGKKVLFISAEMSEMDMARYMKRFPNWSKLPILFLNNFTDQCPKTVVESVINEGWDLILTDSYTEVNDTVKEACNLTRGKVEKWFLDLMVDNNKGLNKSKIHTTFVTILQLSKGGQFVGSNKLKHMTSAMMDINWEGSENSGTRYMEFSKNRCGNVGQKLMYTISGQGLALDGDRFHKDLEYKELLQAEVDQSDFTWDEIFSKATDTSDETVSQPQEV